MRRCWPGLEFDAAHDLPCIRIKSTTTSSSLNQNDFLKTARGEWLARRDVS